MSSTTDAPPSEGIREANKLRTREQIRAAALDLIEARGYINITIDEIVESAGVGRRTFFRYFSCKEAVLFSDGVFQNLGRDLGEALSAGNSPIDALVVAMGRDGYGSDPVDEVTARRRRLRVALLSDPGVSSYYHRAFDTAAISVATAVREHPLYNGTPHLPELLGGLLRTMCLEHLHNGETHHFAVDVASWHRGVRALELGFPAT
jgi:AcrR family transcriptional regulator